VKHAKHLTPTKYGTLAHIRIGGILYQKHFPTGTDPIDMRAWIVDQEIKHRKGPSALGSFDVDAQKYLLAVSSMRSYSDRKRDIEAWIGIFKDRQRDTITSTEIATALQTWRLTLSASSCNSRRAALQHLFTRLDGKGAKNPVRDVPKFPLPQPAARALDYPTIRKILAKVPKGKDKARLMMLAYTGLPHSIIGQLAPENFDPVAKTLAVPGRRKGTGTRGRTLPLTPQGVQAVKMMISTKAWGPFPRYHLRWVFHQACDAAGVARARPYDLRHSFGTEIYRRSGDPRAVQELMLHASDAMGKRYTLAAVPERLRKAIKGFGR
jgi:integrase